MINAEILGYYFYCKLLYILLQISRTVVQSLIIMDTWRCCSRNSKALRMLHERPWSGISKKIQSFARASTCTGSGFQADMNTSFQWDQMEFKCIYIYINMYMWTQKVLSTYIYIYIFAWTWEIIVPIYIEYDPQNQYGFIIFMSNVTWCQGSWGTTARWWREGRIKHASNNNLQFIISQFMIVLL